MQWNKQFTWYFSETLGRSQTSISWNFFHALSNKSDSFFGSASIPFEAMFVMLIFHNSYYLNQFYIHWKKPSKTRCPANIYMFKVNNTCTRKRCELCSKSTTKTPERSQWRRSGIFIVNFEYISHFFLVFSLLTLNK